MKYSPTLVSLLFMTFSALATDSVDLAVKGKLVTGSCTLNLQNNGVIDFGNILLADLQTEDNPIGRQFMPVEIVCDSPTIVGFSMVDNRADSVAPVRPAIDDDGYQWPWAEDEKFGLGKTSDGVNIGAYTFSVKNSSKGFSDDGGKTWNRSSLISQRNNGSRIVSSLDRDSNLPVPVTSFMLTFAVSAAVQGPNELRLTDNTSLDGSATISLIYL
ncbi:DUF1120 domain-containing protein [Enterobacter ludwigii]